MKTFVFILMVSISIYIWLSVKLR